MNVIHPTLPQGPRRINAGDLFFPAAAVHGALTIAFSISLMTGGPGPVGLHTGHGQEMFFGFALALVAGYLGGGLPIIQAGGLLLLWLFARFATWFLPTHLPGLLLSVCFSLWLAAILVPRFKSAKKWRNRAVQPLLLALCLLPLAVFAFSVQDDVSLSLLFPLLPVLLFSLLMTYMGGRIIAPLMAAHSQQRGHQQDARVQPRIEGMLIVLLSAAAVLVLVPSLRWASGACASMAAMLLLLRWIRWRPWMRIDRGDLSGLLLGYLWLALGLMWLGYALVTARSIFVPMHMMTMGAIGTLSLSVMLRQWYQRHRKSHPPNLPMFALVILITIALVCRVLWGLGYGHPHSLLWAAALSWVTAFLGAGIMMFLARGYPHRKTPDQDLV